MKKNSFRSPKTLAMFPHRKRPMSRQTTSLLLHAIFATPVVRQTERAVSFPTLTTPKTEIPVSVPNPILHTLNQILTW